MCGPVGSPIAGKGGVPAVLWVPLKGARQRRQLESPATPDQAGTCRGPKGGASTAPHPALSGGYLLSSALLLTKKVLELSQERRRRMAHPKRASPSARRRTAPPVRPAGTPGTR